jgi:imidazolonepropionase-like amidohydrolase
VEQGSKVIAGPAYYPSLLAGPMYYPWPAFGAYDLGLLARALLRRPDRTLPLLPDGAARLDEVERRDWDEIVASGPDLVRALHEAGVPLVLGTDAPIGGFELHREMELFVRAGIPAPDVLQIATLGAARAMGMEDELGSLEPGKLADLILVDGDPTQDIRDIRRVMRVVKDGRVYDPAALYRALGIRPCCDE